jgi:hypothetical protein
MELVEMTKETVYRFRDYVEKTSIEWIESGLEEIEEELKID